jgi:hypothetical protein
MEGTWLTTWNSSWGWIVVECLICRVVVKVNFIALHVWCCHVTGRNCWCGDATLVDDARSVGEDAEYFWKHCEERGGYLAHYLEFQLGVADA